MRMQIDMIQVLGPIQIDSHAYISTAYMSQTTDKHIV